MEKFSADRDQKWNSIIKSTIEADFKVKKEMRHLTLLPIETANLKMESPHVLPLVVDEKIISKSVSRLPKLQSSLILG